MLTLKTLAHKHPHISDFISFGLKQARASLFGGAMLFALIATRYLWPHDFVLTRYDFLFFYAIFIQASFLLFKMETWEEARVIIVFHVVGTVMEIFKTHMGSWEYPEHNLIRIGGVPLFTGFMYSAIGSYIARAGRIFAQHYENYPCKTATVFLCILIYLNFFTHHFIFDFRILLFAMTFYLYRKTKVYFTPARKEYWMPLLLGFFLISFFIWLAENTGTFCAAWVYPNQKAGWHLVSIDKLGSWFLLMIISFVLVQLVHRDKPESGVDVKNT